MSSNGCIHDPYWMKRPMNHLCILRHFKRGPLGLVESKTIRDWRLGTLLIVICLLHLFLHSKRNQIWMILYVFPHFALRFGFKWKLNVLLSTAIFSRIPGMFDWYPGITHVRVGIAKKAVFEISFVVFSFFLRKINQL